MNNAQFRRLLNNPAQSSVDDVTSKSGSNGHPSKLGNGSRPSMLMTPRAVASSKLTTTTTNNNNNNNNNNFQQQVVQYRNELGTSTENNKSTGSILKDTKFGPGYQDHAALLQRHKDQSAHDRVKDPAERIKALEELVKLGQLDHATFARLEEELGVGGKIENTHLVKGLDWKLLEKVRRGEDVLAATDNLSSGKTQISIQSDGDVDAELESVLEKEVQPMPKGEKIGQGTKAARIPPDSDGPLTRDDILKKLKASRAAAASQVKQALTTKHALGTRFHKVGSQDRPRKEKFVENVDGRRREVLMITNADGTVKRKVRWVDKEPFQSSTETKPSIEKLGMDVPVEMAAKQRAMLKEREEEQESQDIFDGVGADYDPLGETAEDTGDESRLHQNEDAPPSLSHVEERRKSGGDRQRNYFSTTGAQDESLPPDKVAVLDSKLLATLGMKAPIKDNQQTDSGRQLNNTTQSGDSNKELLAKLQKREREDAVDLDLNFGESRFGDNDDDEDGPVWNAGGEEKSQKLGRKRGPKKRKGNRDDVKDVMAVLNRGRK